MCVIRRITIFVVVFEGKLCDVNVELFKDCFAAFLLLVGSLTVL